MLNNDLYEEVIQKGIFIDLKESTSEEEQKEEIEEVKENFSFQHQKMDGRAVSQSQRQKKQRKKSNSGIDEDKLPLPHTKTKKIPPLSSDLLKAMNNEEFSDITLIIGDKKIYAHRVVLASRSKFFEAMFSHEYKEAQGEITLQDISYELFIVLLEYIYSDQIAINLKQIFDILALAD